MPRILMVVDRPDWAFDTIAKELIRWNTRSFELDLCYLKGLEEQQFYQAYQEADLLFFFHWSLACLPTPPRWKKWFKRSTPFSEHQLIPRFQWLDFKKCIVGIHSHHDHDDRLSQPDHLVIPPMNLVEFLSQFKAVHAVSQRLVGAFKQAGLSVHYTPNGVNIEQFKPTQPIQESGALRVGCSGTKKRDWKEGITEYIEPLAQLPFVTLHQATPPTHPVPYEDMPDFLNGTDVYVLASASEGFPLKVLEAAACGRAVITTRVGGCEDLIIDGETGFFVERSFEAFSQKLELLHQDRSLLKAMGMKNREIVEKHWSWEQCHQPWIDFIECHL